MNGTGDAKIAKLFINSELVVNVQSTDNAFNLNTEGHGDITSHNVLWHSSGKHEYSANVEVELQPGAKKFDPATFDENNPVDLLVMEANCNIRYLQGVVKEGSVSNAKDQTGKLKFTLHQFKDRIFE